jgi:hypothetical protein
VTARLPREPDDRLDLLTPGERVFVLPERVLDRARMEMIAFGGATFPAPLGVVARDSAQHASALITDPSRRVIVLLDGTERHAARGDLVRVARRDRGVVEGLRRVDERAA